MPLTTDDIFNIVASISLAVFTVFGCLALYHVIAIVSRAHQLVDAIEDMLQRVGKLSTYLGMVGSAAQIIKNKFSDEGEEEIKPRSRKKRK